MHWKGSEDARANQTVKTFSFSLQFFFQRNMSPALQMVKNATYNTFQSTVQNAIGHETSVKQIAMLFHLTKGAVQIAGAGGALAMQIKENTLRYFEDKFAAWIVGQGGWVSYRKMTCPCVFFLTHCVVSLSPDVLLEAVWCKQC